MPYKGIIKNVENQRALVLLEDGFEEWYALRELVCIPSHQWLDEIEHKDSESYIEYRPIRTHEVDLHIEHLTVHHATIESYRVLDYQLSAFRDEWEYALRNGYDEMLVIHGKGIGVLRNALLQILAEKNIHQFQHIRQGQLKDAAILITIQRI